tara:strand:- start:113 stop:643 length:531 start_codon:yes stop_codon:yes gene_type:complete
MGLDNMPHKYPCETQGTAVMEQVELYEFDLEGGRRPTGETTERIDCVETVAADGCPFTNAKPPPGQVTGMLGTFCWYRGKYGNALIRALSGQDMDDYFADEGDDNFYGTDEDGLYRPPEACVALADQMESALDEKGGILVASEGGNTGEDVTDEAKFAIWYLRWVAEECDGMDAWF